MTPASNTPPDSERFQRALVYIRDAAIRQQDGEYKKGWVSAAWIEDVCDSVLRGAEAGQVRVSHYLDLRTGIWRRLQWWRR